MGLVMEWRTTQLTGQVKLCMQQREADSEIKAYVGLK